MAWEASSRGMDCLEDCICSMSIHASLSRGHTTTRWHGDDGCSLFHLHWTLSRVPGFALVCYRQKMGDTWHFPVGQNDPKCCTFFAKLEFFSPVILRDNKFLCCRRAYFPIIKLISVNCYSTLSENPTVHQVLSEHRASYILHPGTSLGSKLDR